MDIEPFINISNQRDFVDQQSLLQVIPYELNYEQSEQENIIFCRSVDEVEQQLLRMPQIVDMHMQKIVQLATLQFSLAIEGVGELIKRMKKTKNILKRNRVKAKKGCSYESMSNVKRQFIYEQSSSTEKDTMTLEKQYKKQKNRVSAQISRDRKKNYLTSLQLQNKVLMNQKQQLQLENQRLQKLSTDKSSPGTKGKFMRLLMLLGIVFLFYIFKDILSYKGGKTKTSTPILNQQSEKYSDILNLEENDDVIEEIKATISSDEILIQQHKSQSSKNWISVRQKLLQKIEDISSMVHQFLVPNQLNKQLSEIKQMLSL